jgi:hypothetical protein
MINSPKKSSNLFKVDDSLKTFLNKPKKASDIVDSLTNGNKNDHDEDDDEEEIIGGRKSRSKKFNGKYFDEDEEEAEEKKNEKDKKNNAKKDDLYDNENSNSGDEDPCVVSKDEYNKNKKLNGKVVENKKSKTINSPVNTNDNNQNATKLSTNGRYEDINFPVKGNIIYLLNKSIINLLILKKK